MPRNHRVPLEAENQLTSRFFRQHRRLTFAAHNRALARGQAPQETMLALRASSGDLELK